MTEPSPYDQPIPVVSAWVTEVCAAVVLAGAVGLGLPYAARVALAYEAALPAALRWAAGWSGAGQVLAAVVAALPWWVLLACSQRRPACRLARRVYLALAVAFAIVALLYTATSFDPP